jgi:hypothetical protein
MGSIRDIAGGVVKAVEDAVSGRTKTGLSKEAVDEFRGTLDWKGAIEEFRHKGIGDLLKNIFDLDSIGPEGDEPTASRPGAI